MTNLLNLCFPKHFLKFWVARFNSYLNFYHLDLFPRWESLENLKLKQMTEEKGSLSSKLVPPYQLPGYPWELTSK